MHYWWPIILYIGSLFITWHFYITSFIKIIKYKNIFLCKIICLNFFNELFTLTGCETVRNQFWTARWVRETLHLHRVRLKGCQRREVAEYKSSLMRCHEVHTKRPGMKILRYIIFTYISRAYQLSGTVLYVCILARRGTWFVSAFYYLP